MNDLSEFVVLSDTTLTTDSRRVAKHFKKRHDNVLQAFDRLECGEEFSRLNFQVAEEMDSQGKPRSTPHAHRMLQRSAAYLLPQASQTGLQRTKSLWLIPAQQHGTKNAQRGSGTSHA